VSWLHDPTTLAAVLAAIAGSFGWRLLGAAFVSRIDPNGPVFQWFTYASYAILAGLLTRLLILPIGELSTVPLAIRMGAAGLGIAAFFLARRNLLVGVAAGTAAFALAVGWF